MREDLVTRLRNAQTPDGELVFERVAPREEFFEGPAAKEAIDIVTVPNEFDQFLSATLTGETFGPPTEPWNHKREGIVAVRGEAIDATASSETETGSDRAPEAGEAEGLTGGIENAHLFDVAPTVLATLSLPSAERMDGTALPIVESAGEEAYASADRGERVATDDSAVESRLSDLGYIE